MTFHIAPVLPGFWSLLWASIVVGVGLCIGGRIVAAVCDGRPFFGWKGPVR